MKKALFALVVLFMTSCSTSGEIFTVSKRDAKKVYNDMIKEEKAAFKKYGSMNVAYDSLYASKY